MLTEINNFYTFAFQSLLPFLRILHFSIAETISSLNVRRLKGKYLGVNNYCKLLTCFSLEIKNIHILQTFNEFCIT